MQSYNFFLLIAGHVEDFERMFRLIAALSFIGIVCGSGNIENQVLLDSWAPYHVGNPTDIGVKLFLAWLNAYPKVQAEFPDFKNIPLNQLKNLPAFRMHATRMYHVLDDAIMKKNWIDVENLSAYHKALGKTNKTEYNQFRAVFMKQLNLNAVKTLVWNKYLDTFFHHLFIHF